MNSSGQALRALLRPRRHHRRPADLIYGEDERPPVAALAVLSVQHVATVLASIAYVLATARLAGLSVEQTQSVVAVSLIGMGLCTALQAIGGRLGAGSLLVHEPDPYLITVAAAAIAVSGPGALSGVTIVAALAALAIAPLLPRLRAVFPPTVAGTIICMGGFTLVEPSVRHAFGIHAEAGVDPASALISLAALACIVGLSVWGGQRLRLLGLLGGIVVGLVIAGLTGHLQGFEALAGVPVVAVPDVPRPVFSMGPGLLFAVVLISVLSQLDNIGSVIVMDKMNDADWHRADMRVVSRSIQANGLGDLISGFFGGFTTSVNPANIALAHATRSTSRVIGLATAALLAIIAFLPQLTRALALIPEPVLGAVELYAAVFLIVSGIELIASRALDSRGIFMVGFSMCAGMSVMLLPGITRGVSEDLKFLVESGFVVTGLVVIALNLLFRIGTRRRAEAALQAGPGHPPLNQQVTDFVETQGAAWSARVDVVRRASMAALEGAEIIAARGSGNVLAIRGHFNEFNLDLELVHAGPPLDLQRRETPVFSEGDDFDDHLRRLDESLGNVGAVLLHHWADAVVAEPVDPDRSLLRLHFDH